VTFDKITKLRGAFFSSLAGVIDTKLHKFTTKEIFKLANFLHLLLIFAALVIARVDFGYAVSVNGVNYGIVASAKIAEAAIFDAYDSIVTFRGDEYKFDKADYHIVITSRNQIIAKDDMSEKILTSMDGLSQAYGITVGGEVVTALATEEEANTVLEEIKTEYLSGGRDAKFSSEVAAAPTRITPEAILSAEDALKVLNGTKDALLTHTVASGDTFSSIALEYGVNTKELMEANPNVVPERLQIGQKLLVSTPQPLVSVEATEIITVIEKIPYPSTQQNDNKLYKGVKNVLKAGIQGEKQVQYRVTKVNGKVVNKDALSETVLKEPEAELVAVGTLEKPKSAPSGVYKRPYYGAISSRFGMRWGRMHTGMDYAGKVGDPVASADGGTVIFTGWGGGYGNMIKVSHGNGIETWYAHLSAINVSTGQKVAQGQTIGKLGNTGNSTGPHLHFEVRKNGAAQNPANYVK
jgi:murein DD-endopeptidase MepM/ murein hydrolase activator NlpD